MLAYKTSTKSILWVVATESTISESLASSPRGSVRLLEQTWWKPDPDLRDANVKIKRWVRKKTAIGPKNKGGMNNMDWTIHSEGFTSEWFIRYAHPTQSAWKEILDYMLFTDKQGNLTVEKQEGATLLETHKCAKIKTPPQTPQNSQIHTHMPNRLLEIIT